ncbi:hypothetical protein QWZ08_25835 [Ferruginibacter paludis]|uniref:hypothetical protein n=1 Tax=Ferruginibacter paludis TaxID=1310417 RepID=UPI0025B4171C|nr:hypothetical protein [Ferruginibacter paludis]MDN3659092.1 hypothetical protein [Ferruginibacter paludis]
MAILDFLIFHLTYWFNKNKDKLKWSTPLERAIYAMGSANMMFLTGVNELIGFTILRDKDVHIGSIWFILLGLGTMQVYK